MRKNKPLLARQKIADWSRRKYRTAWYLTIIFIALLVLPAVVSLALTLLVQPLTFSLLPVEAFVTVIMFIWATYFGANVVEKHKSFSDKPRVTLDGEDMMLEEFDEEDWGGQPRYTDNR